MSLGESITSAPYKTLTRTRLAPPYLPERRGERMEEASKLLRLTDEEYREDEYQIYIIELQGKEERSVDGRSCKANR